MPSPAQAKFACAMFNHALDLQVFVSTTVTVASVVSIVVDPSGKFVLFYMTT